MKNKLTYSEKLKDPRWQKKRLEIFQRDNFKCLLCGDSESTLHVHHKSYRNNPWEVDSSDLKTLCAECHYVVEALKKDGFDVLSVFKSKNTDIDIVKTIIAVCNSNDYKSKIASIFLVSSNGFISEMSHKLSFETISVIYEIMK